MFPKNAWYVACTPDEIDSRPLAALCTLTVNTAGDIGSFSRHIWSSRPIIAGLLTWLQA